MENIRRRREELNRILEQLRRGLIYIQETTKLLEYADLYLGREEIEKRAIEILKDILSFYNDIKERGEVRGIKVRSMIDKKGIVEIELVENIMVIRTKLCSPRVITINIKLEYKLYEYDLIRFLFGYVPYYLICHISELDSAEIKNMIADQVNKNVKKTRKEIEEIKVETEVF